MKVSAFVAISLDGYLARSNGDIDWMSGGGSGGDYGYENFFASIGTMIMGRRSYEKALTFEYWPYGKKPVYVLSSKYVHVPVHLARHVEGSKLAPVDLLAQIAAAGVSRVSLDGGETIRSFIAAARLDDLTITHLPLILGAGRPLFADGIGEHALERMRTLAFDDGLVQSHYRLLDSQNA